MLQPAKWSRNKQGSECPVCGDPYFTIRVLLGEDTPQISEDGFLNITWQQVANEYLHKSGQYCSKKLLKYVKLDEPELEVIRPGNDEDA